MKRAARPPLHLMIGLVPLSGYGDSRNMAARIDSEESRGERTLYRSPGGARWMTDAPEAETHLLQGIRRLTRLNVAREGTALRLFSMLEVYPDREIVELPVTDEVFHVLYDLIERPQIPSIYGRVQATLARNP